MPRRKYPIFHENDLITEGVMWVDIPDFEDYIISELGEVISKQRMIACKNGINRMKSATKINPLKKKNGYVYIILKKGDVYETKRLHRLVAQACIPNPNNYEQVNHLDGNKSNNVVSNLEWCSQSHNMKHAYVNGLVDHYTRTILKLDVNSKMVIDEFSSLNEASKSVNAKSEVSARSCIYKCCNNKLNSAYGYLWKYKTER